MVGLDKDLIEEQLGNNGWQKDGVHWVVPDYVLEALKEHRLTYIDAKELMELAHDLIQGED